MNKELQKIIAEREIAAAAAEHRLATMTSVDGVLEKDQLCAAAGCGARALSKGYCGGHYQDKQRFVKVALDQKKKDFKLPKRI